MMGKCRRCIPASLENRTGRAQHREGNIMTRKLSAITLTAALAASAAAIQVRAAGDKIAFPENFASGVMYTTVDRADNKRYLELFTAPAALDAAKKGEPLPSGTVITIVNYNAQVDAQGNPVKDA